MDESTIDPNGPENSVTRSQDTQDKYLERGQQLKDRAAKFLQRTPDWLDVARWAHDHLRPVIRKSSWRQYRAAIIASATRWAEDRAEDNPFEIDSTFEMVQKIQSLMQEGVGGDNVPKNLRRTSSMKQKSLPEEDMTAIEDYVSRRSSNEYLGLVYFLRASILTGLRPSEWFSAEIIDDGYGGSALVVLNGKHSNGRAHGEKRTISLNHLSEADRKIVETNHKMLSVRSTQNPEMFNEILRLYRRRLNYLSRKLWPRRKRRPTLYSGRHQFSADCKARGCNLVEIAALMGHASDETASEHYGRRVSGSMGPRPQANEEDMAKVRRVFARNPANQNQNNQD